MNPPEVIGMLLVPLILAIAMMVSRDKTAHPTKITITPAPSAMKTREWHLPLISGVGLAPRVGRWVYRTLRCQPFTRGLNDLAEGSYAALLFGSSFCSRSTS